MAFRGVQKYDTDHYEYFKNVEMIDPEPLVIKAYIPKYMPKIQGGTWRTTYPINRGILANATDCMVDLPPVVGEQGFYTLTKYPLEQPNFMPKATEISRGVWKVLPWNNFLAEVMHGDTEKIKFTGKV